MVDDEGEAYSDDWPEAYPDSDSILMSAKDDWEDD